MIDMTSTKKGKAKPKRTVVTRQYIFTQGELKRMLGMEGDIKQMDLWAGTAPIDETPNMSRDDETYFIDTEEADRDG